MPKFNRHRIVFGLYLLVLIAAAVLIADHFKLPAWPAFMAMIFFFVEEMNPAKVAQILVGGVFGFFFMIRRPPKPTRLPTLIPYTTHLRPNDHLSSEHHSER